MLRTTPALSDAILKLYSAKSLASAKPPLTAIASSVSGFDIPITTMDDALRNWPKEFRATAAYDALPVFFDMVASTLIFISPDGGGIHRGGLAATLFSLADGCWIADSRS
jgi:hypothetical protein